MRKMMKRVGVTPVLVVLLAAVVRIVSYRWEAHSAGFCQAQFPAIKAYVVLVGGTVVLTSLSAVLERRTWRVVAILAVIAAMVATCAYLWGVFQFAGTQRQCFS